MKAYTILKYVCFRFGCAVYQYVVKNMSKKWTKENGIEVMKIILNLDNLILIYCAFSYIYTYIILFLNNIINDSIINKYMQNFIYKAKIFNFLHGKCINSK